MRIIFYFNILLYQKKKKSQEFAKAFPNVLDGFLKKRKKALDTERKIVYNCKGCCANPLVLVYNKLFDTAKGGRKMAEIRVKEGESLDSALRRFKRATARSGVLAELRKREHYEKPSVKRKKKSEAARKRKYK